MGRAPCCQKVGLKRGRWTAEEDEILTKYIQLNGEGSWRSLPKNAGLLRCGKSCRLRWINYLRADLKRGNITAEEETLIIKLHTTMGNRWSLIAGQLPGRTDNEIKNYWNSHLSRKIHTFTRRRPTDGTPLTVMELDNKTDGFIKKRRGGSRTSRSAMKRTKEYRTTHKLGGVPKLPPRHPLPLEASKEAPKSSSSPVAIMPVTPTIDTEESILPRAISWSEEDLESFFTESYSIDDVLLLASNKEVECNNMQPHDKVEEENREIIRSFNGFMNVDDNDMVDNMEEIQFGAFNSCFEECRDHLDKSNDRLLLTLEEENLKSTGLVEEKKMEENRSGTMELDNSFCTLSPGENQENCQLQFWCPTSPVLSMMENDEWQIRNFDTLVEGGDDVAGGNEEGMLSWLSDTSPYEGKCCNQDGNELVEDLDKQNAMVAWLLS